MLLLFLQAKIKWFSAKYKQKTYKHERRKIFFSVRGLQNSVLETTLLEIDAPTHNCQRWNNIFQDCDPQDTQSENSKKKKTVRNNVLKFFINYLKAQSASFKHFPQENDKNQTVL